MHDIEYKESYILHNIDKMRSLAEKDYPLSPVNRAVLAISLYRLARAIGENDDINRTSDVRHAELAQMLSDFDRLLAG